MIDVRIAGAAYAVPSETETIADILRRERRRVDAVLAPLSETSRRRAMEGLGLERVRVCGSRRPYALVREAAAQALDQAGLSPRRLDLILDYSTLPGEESPYVSFANRLSSEWGAEGSLNLTFKAGGCAGLHLALKTAIAWMGADPDIRSALLVCGDSPPPGNRSMLPITVQGDAGSAIVLRRDGGEGPAVLAVEVQTAGYLHDAISLVGSDGRLEICVDSVRMENEVMPVYYLSLLRLVTKALARSSLQVSDVDHFIYSNISERDRDGFRRMLGLPEGALPVTAMAEYGHTFASDLVINYADLRKAGGIHPGQLLLFASAGIGFAWGVTLARA
ncbi:MAG: 3-oxoacyl-[acyl-carrier-protein] synthase III C-terminal domain-containing protein [Bryobacteraceae bacterium]|jgi:3-oxoacyl-[acyl-carrier-protein] synthase-3